MSLPSRKARRRRSRNRDFADLWRAVGWVCMLAMLLFMTVQGTYAYMSDSGSVSTTVATGSFGSLMTLASDPGSLNFSGRVGDSFSGTITVTSQASVPLPISAHWDGPAPGGASIGITSGTIGPSSSVQVSVSGTFWNSGTGSVRVSIGQNFDSTSLPVQVTALAWPISQFITLRQQESLFQGAEFSNLKVAEIAQVTGQPAIPIQIHLSQKSSSDSPVSVVSPTGSTISSSAAVTAIHISQAEMQKGATTHVTLTISSTAPYVTGTQTVTFELANPAEEKSTEVEAHEEAVQAP